MSNKKLIAQALFEIAKNSTTELIDDTELDLEIIDSANKMGLVIPSPDIAIFKTKWADIGKKNLNNVILPKKAVEKGIQTLVGKNLNFEHRGAYNLCGFCLSVKIVEDYIECIQVFYKSVYPEEFEELKEKIKTKEAAVSFEIWNKNEKGDSVVNFLEDGTAEITEIHCHGTGLLLINPPACPTAKIFKLVAKKINENSDSYTSKKFEDNMVYAQLAIDEPKCQNCANCTCKKEGTKVEIPNEIVEAVEKIEEQKTIEENVVVAEKKLCGECQKELLENEETMCAECKSKKENAEVKVEETIVPAEVTPEETKVTPEETKVEAEVIPEPIKAEVVPEQTLVPVKLVKEILEVIEITETAIEENGNTSVRRGLKRTTKIYSDEKVETFEEQFDIVDKYSLAEVDAKIKEVIDAKNKEIEVANVKLGEKEVEIANLKKAEEVVEKPNLTVGSVVIGEDKYSSIRKQINIKAFGHE